MFKDLVTRPILELTSLQDIQINQELGLFNEFNFQNNEEITTNLIIVGDSSNEMQAGVALHKYLVNNQKKRVKKGNIENQSSTSTNNSICVPVNIKEKKNDLSS